MLRTVPAEVQPGGVSSPKRFFCGGRPCPVTGKATVMSSVQGEFDFTPTGSKTTSTVGNFPHGSREIPATSAAAMAADRPAQARCRTADTHVAGKPVELVLATTQANKRGSDSRGRSLPREGVRPRETHGPHAWPGHSAGDTMNTCKLASTRGAASTFDPR
jgi:hypothetical protein